MALTTLDFECLVGMQCKDFAIVAADQTNTRSILVMKHDENKLYEIQNGLVMGAIGDPADRVQLAQFIDKNVQLYKMRNGYKLNTAAVVHFTRKTMIQAMKVSSMVKMLVAGYDDVAGGQLYTIDFLASALRVPFGVHGIGGLLSLGILDTYHKAELTEFEAYEVIKRCVHEVHERFLISLPNFMVKLVNKHGIKEMPVITPATYLRDHPE